MSEHLTFPRLVYRGAADTLGTGQDAKGHPLHPLSETARVEDQADLDAHLKDGWRLTREDGKKPKDADQGAIRIPAQTVIVDEHDNPDAHARADAKAHAAKDAADAEATAKGKKGLAAPAKNAHSTSK